MGDLRGFLESKFDDMAERIIDIDKAARIRDRQIADRLEAIESELDDIHDKV